MTEPETIRCRAQATRLCYQGRPSAEIYGKDEPGMSGDGSFNGESVVCDACYIVLGTPTNAELEEMGL